MPDTVDYALLSTRVYDASYDNRTGVPAGWTELTWSKDYNSSGFSAGAYRRGSEVVIAYTGTNQTLDWFTGNTAGLGLLPAPQVFDAMRFYLDVKAANPGATITLTGHSLGGGLASLMSVFFDKQAVVFDEAPFQYSAINPLLLTSLEASLLLTGYTDMDFALYNASFGTMFPFREGNVSHIYLDGEILGTGRAIAPAIAGAESAVSMGASTLGAGQRHTMTLLTAMLGNTQFASAVQQLPNLATYLLDSAWFGVTDRRTPDTIDLMSTLLRWQYGADGVTADGRLDRFAADMQQLVGTVGTAQANSSMRDALMTASMEYFHAKAATTADKLFAVEGNGLHFKYSDIGATSYKSLPLLARAIEALIGPAQSAQTGAYSQLLKQDAWHIQSGSAGMVWTATGADNDAAIGGEQADVLNAGAGNDVVLGMGGNDTISGGTGNDILLGGQGGDVYIYNSGDGFDLIFDQDGGSIVDDGITLTGGSQYGDARVHRDGNGHIYVKVDQGMMIDGNMFLQGDSDGTRFGLVMTGATADVNPTTDNPINGDLAPKDFDADTAGIQTQLDVLGNVIVTANAEPDRADVLYDSAGNDRITSGGGNDRIYATRGDDIIEAGAGQDYVNGGIGNDVIMGGAGNDYLFDSEVVPKRHIDRRIKVRYLCKKNFLRYRTFAVRNSGGRQRRAA